MGCGKSSVGRRVAQMTGHRFLDTDDLIVEKAGKPITEIFSDSGESEFRRMESSVLRDLSGVAGIVLATGGGMITRGENIERLRQIGVVAWLDAAPDLLFERVSRNQRRPLLQTENPRQTFDELLSNRLDLYEKSSDFRVDSSGLSHEEAARCLLSEALRVQAERQRI